MKKIGFLVILFTLLIFGLVLVSCDNATGSGNNFFSGTGGPGGNNEPSGEVSGGGVVGTWICEQYGLAIMLVLKSNRTFTISDMSGMYDDHGTYRVSGNTVFFLYDDDYGEEWATVSGNTMNYGGLIFNRS
jgi:hypothetical protein